MYEEEVLKVSENFQGDTGKFFVLTNGAHNREMYIRSGDKAALNFIKPKFESSFKKRTAHKMLRMGLLQPFLKKVRLPTDTGSLILVGNQIKAFNIDNKLVYSFQHYQDNEKFISDKHDQLEISKEGYAPHVIKVNDDKVYCCEEMVIPYTGDIAPAFEKLLEYYHRTDFIKMTPESLNFDDFMDKEKIDPMVDRAFSDINKMSHFLISNIHGEFAKEQVVTDDVGNIMFVDWDSREGLITEDLVNMFRNDPDYFLREEFLQIIQDYPQHVQDHLKEYLLLTEIIRAENDERDLPLSMVRIRNIIQYCNTN